MKLILTVFAMTFASHFSLSAADPVNVTPEEAAQWIASEKDVVVIDVRTPAEFEEGHLKDALNLDFTENGFAAQLEKLDKEKPYLVHCEAGIRSGRSMEVFKKLGFTNIRHLVKGYRGWVEAGLPIVK